MINWLEGETIGAKINNKLVPISTYVQMIESGRIMGTTEMIPTVLECIEDINKIANLPEVMNLEKKGE